MTLNSNETNDRPVVSVIIPARNEEASIGQCLHSILLQSEIDYEVIVVNDHSSDRTSAVAESFSGVQVINADPLPQGWVGKNHACFCGARVARGQWLLFTDADTVHRRRSLKRAVREAEDNDADLLSYSPKQEVTGIFQRALMPVIFAELRKVFPPEKVRDPRSNIAAANGQYLLISREAYDGIGGHEAVRHEILEDVAIAKLVKSAGAIIRFRYGGDAVKTRMYRTFAQMRDGWTKNLALLFPSTTALAVMRGLEAFLVFAGLVLIGLGFQFNSLPFTLAGMIVALPLLANFFVRVRRAHFGWINTIISPLGLPLFVLLLLRSRLHYKRNDVIWKGRHYRPEGRSSGLEPTAAKPSDEQTRLSHSEM